MDYQPRTIAFLAELLHPPQAPDPRPIQQLHNSMFQSGVPAYSSFAVTPMGPVLSNPSATPGSVSQAAFLADRVQFREEQTSLGPEDFAERVAGVAGALAEARGLQLFLAQQVTLRSLISLRNYKDAREFLRLGLFGLAERLEEFPADPSIYGIRLAFPAVAQAGNDPLSPPDPAAQASWGLRIESYASDPRSLFLEIQGAFGPAAASGQAQAIRPRVLEAYRFLESRALAFVSRFDAPLEA